MSRVGAARIKVGIGFVTGRKNFKQVVRAYLDNWKETDLSVREQYELHLFVAYDLKYMGTDASDYKITDDDILGVVDSAHYLGNAAIANEVQELAKQNVVTLKEAKLVFGEGYAMKRNAVLYFALKAKMNYLIFLDDDEYPIANLKMGDSLVWRGQNVLSTHILNLQYTDITHGHHCGYVSPIPQIRFNDTFRPEDFRLFIEAISNDIVNWESIRRKMEDGGITYADLDTMNCREVTLVKEMNGMKFISGANLGLNLNDPDKLFPFYNPPGARGEDTFLSTCIGACDIRKVPCYTFHDGFAVYPKILSGVPPNQLKAMDTRTSANYKRFLQACVGWIRYKPLLTYITRKADYSTVMAQLQESLSAVIPKLCSFFGNQDFQKIQKECSFYQAHVTEHYRDFEGAKRTWRKVIASL